jgi:hypothetical protein
MEDTNFYTQTVRRMFGRNRGSLWRADKEWFAGDMESTEVIQHRLKAAEEYAKQERESFHNKGWTKGKTMKFLGWLPPEVSMCHPELYHDDNVMRRFFKDNPGYSARGFGGEK